MFSDQKKSKVSEPTREQSKIAAGTVITGEVTSKGAFRIEGTLEGNLKTPGRVVISKGGIVNGSLECESADIEGKFTGNLQVKDTLSLRSTAVVDGEVVAGKLAVEPGANFNATCQMTGGVKALKKENEKRSA